jgi:transposase
MPFCDTEAMQSHLGEISANVALGAHAVVILDQAGWHLSKDLVVPRNLTLLSLPPRSPELNPVENVWQFLRDNWLSNRVFPGYDDSSPIAAKLGTTSWTSRGGSGPSAGATGPMGF